MANEHHGPTSTTHRRPLDSGDRDQLLPPRYDVLGVGVSAVDMTRAVEVITRWVEEGSEERDGGDPPAAAPEGHRATGHQANGHRANGHRPGRYVCVTGVHGVMEAQRDPELLAIHNRSGLTTPDGMPLVWSARWLRLAGVERVYGPDLMLAVCQRAAERGWRSYFYGGADGVPERLAAALQQRFPGLAVAGTLSPPFRPLTPDEDARITDEISATRPDLLWVGLSTPKQERWMAEHVDRLGVPAVLGVGAAFDIHAGTKTQAPGWMQRNGLEWLYRLAHEPRRLGRRYLVNNPRFVLRVLRSPPTPGTCPAPGPKGVGGERR